MYWIPLALLSAVCAAFVAIFGKIGLASVDSTVATTVRAIIMAFFLLLVTVSLGKAHLIGSISGKAYLYIVLSGIAGALSWLLYFWALQLGPVTAVAALDKTSIVFVAILSMVVLNQTFSMYTIIGSALVAVGALITLIR